jgi:Uma2 family endonuclease
MSYARRLHYSYADYLQALADSEIKLEFCDGIIYAMAGGTPAHAELSANIIRLLGQALLGTCKVFTSDLKVRVERSDLSTFPDATVVCGSLAVSTLDPQAVVNPTVIVEVTSNSTEDSDRGDKLSHYKQLDSLNAVLFISHRTQRVTLIERQGSSWIESDHRSGEHVRISQPQLSFDVDAVYKEVALES